MPRRGILPALQNKELRRVFRQNSDNLYQVLVEYPQIADEAEGSKDHFSNPFFFGRLGRLIVIRVEPNLTQGDPDLHLRRSPTKELFILPLQIQTTTKSSHIPRNVTISDLENQLVILLPLFFKAYNFPSYFYCIYDPLLDLICARLKILSLTR